MADNKHYENVTIEQMKDFLEPQDFEIIERDKLPGTFKYVFGKRVDCKLAGRHVQLTLRVFSGINFDGQSRESGKDAIRVALFARNNQGKVEYLGGDVHVKRLPTWRKNLQSRLDRWHDYLPSERAVQVILGEVTCPKCGAPLAIRKPKDKKKSAFVGCTAWKPKSQGCNYTETL